MRRHFTDDLRPSKSFGKGMVPHLDSYTFQLAVVMEKKKKENRLKALSWKVKAQVECVCQFTPPPQRYFKY